MTDTPLPQTPDQPDQPAEPGVPNPDQPNEPAPVPDAELENADDEAERTVGRHRDDYGR